jgi:hypothetical protein
MAIQAAETLFEQMCEARHIKGERKYGALTFLDNPTLDMALEEIVDLANYARYTFIKVVILKFQIAQMQKQAAGGTDGFFTTEQIVGLQKEI